MVMFGWVILAFLSLSEITADRDVRYTAAVPDHIPLANFTQILQEARHILSQPGYHSVDLEPCTLRTTYIKLWGELITFEKFRLFGMTSMEILDVHQKTDEEDSVYFSISIPRIDAVGAVDFRRPSGGERVIINSKEKKVLLKVRVTVRQARSLIKMRVVRVSRSYAVAEDAMTWFSSAIDPNNQKVISSIVLKAVDPCVENLLRSYVHIVNGLLRGKTIKVDNKIAIKVAKIAERKLNPMVEISPFEIPKKVKCFERHNKIVLKMAEIDSLENCTIVRPSMDRNSLNVVFSCKHLVFFANTTITDPKNHVENFEAQVVFSAYVFGKVVLEGEHRGRHRIITGLHPDQLSIYRYDTESVIAGKAKESESLTSECVRRFIFVNGKSLMKKVVVFD